MLKGALKEAQWLHKTAAAAAVVAEEKPAAAVALTEQQERDLERQRDALVSAQESQAATTKELETLNAQLDRAKKGCESATPAEGKGARGERESAGRRGGGKGAGASRCWDGERPLTGRSGECSVTARCRTVRSWWRVAGRRDGPTPVAVS